MERAAPAALQLPPTAVSPLEINTPEKQEHTRTHLGIAMSHLVFFPQPITADGALNPFVG
jgi:hypothetical protein